VTRARTLVALAAVGVGVALIATQLDVGEAIKEVTLPLRHDDIIRQQAADKDLDPALIAAVINAESGFDPHARSSAGARGLMQVTPQTAQAIANESGGVTFQVSDLEDPQINISYGAYHLRELLDAYDGNEIAALAAYNAGSGNVDAWGGASIGLDQIRFPETRAYVENVLDKRDEYRRSYPDDLGL
jgi:soluble lytic murein transglycosylase